MDKKGGSLSIFLILIAVVILSLLLSVQVLKNFPKPQIFQSTATNGSLKAKFTIGPIQPVCRSSGQPCDGSYADKAIEIYREGDHSLVITKNTDNAGDLTISLPQGNYYLMTKESLGIERKQRQVSFTITNGQVTEADVKIDTGIR